MNMLQKKLDALVYGDVIVTEEISEYSSAIKIIIIPEQNAMRKFDYHISRFEVEHSCNYLGMDTYVNLVSGRILDRYVISVLDRFVKGGSVSIKANIVN